MIRLEHVTKFFDDKPAVADVSFNVPRGSVFGLIGPNGAGKTTTLQMLATLMKPDSGRIEIAGVDALADVRAVRRRIGFMPDQFGAFRGLSCEEYLRFFGRAYDLGGAELRSRVNDVLELTEMAALRDEATNALSTGLRQRLSLAKTLMHDPDLLLLDEPASGLDPRARIEIRVLLQELARMNKTIVISSHILSDLEEICTDVGMIEHGTLVWCGRLDHTAQADASDAMRCRLEVNERQLDAAKKLIEGVGYATILRQAPRQLDLELDGRRGNELLTALIAADIEVVGFTLDKTSLETLFLQQTRGALTT